VSKEKMGIERGNALADRLARYGGDIVQLVSRFPRCRAATIIKDQLLRSSLSVGAHYEEARGAQSRKDFIYKISVGLKELRESVHWLRVARYSGWETFDSGGLEAECHQLVRILAASKATGQKNLKREN
jgi:four helix bundle protein